MAFGDGDATFRACGGIEGIQELVEAFYVRMDTLSEAKRIRAMHPSDLEVTIDKLARFLCGWTGGPKRFSEKYGPIKIPLAHAHLEVGEAERDAWLLCMEHALVDRSLPEDLKQYLIEQLYVPAERIRVVVAERAEKRGEDIAQEADRALEGGRTP